MKRLLLLILIMLPTWLIGQTTIKTNFVINKTAPTLTLIGTGGVINFNSDILFRHSLNTITIEGGNLSLGTNSLLTTGSLGSTGSRILKGWFTDLDVSNLPTFNGVSLLYGLTDTITKSFTTVSALNTLLAAKQDTGVVSMTYPDAGIALSTGSAWGTSITNNSVNWDTAYAARMRWSGTPIGLTAATGRTSLGGTTVGQAFFTLTNPTAVTFPQINADNTVSALSASAFTTAIKAGHVASVTATFTAGVLSDITLTGVTTKPYHIMIQTTAGKDITSAVSDSLGISGGIYHLYVYSVDLITDAEIKVIH